MKLTFITTLFWATAVLCAAAEQAYIGYIYPAGGQQGSEVYVTVGGQFLRQPQKVHISGKGIKATVIEFYPPIMNLKKEQRDWIIDWLKEAAEDSVLNSNGANRSAEPPQVLPEGIKVPRHPLLYELENKSLRQLVHVQQMLLRPQSKIQPNRQISEAVLLKLTIEPDAEPGPRELRMTAAAGLTNPVTIHVGTLPEYCEMEPNDDDAYPTRVQRFPDLPDTKPLELPIVLNGQILPGDIDRFRFHAQAGQQLVIETHARSLIPYLADAVPGWFQAVAALYDAAGNEIAFADDYRFNPDPVLYYKIIKTGDYELVIRDSIYRGREDFVYRISVGELPFITEMFPLGGCRGVKTTASVAGWNLPVNQIELDTSADKGDMRHTTMHAGNTISNAVCYAVDTLPEMMESQLHGDIKTAQRVQVPGIVNGRISSPGETDIYKFEGKKGDEITIEVQARRFNSPLDSLVRLTDASGKVMDWNDDYSVKDKDYLFTEASGLLTHHADSLLSVKLPSDGVYYVHLADTQGHAGPAYAYRLHIKDTGADFALRVTPSGASAPAGGIIPLMVHVLPKNRCEGSIEVFLKDPATGFQLDGGVIPAGKDSIRMTLKIADKVQDEFVAVKLQGRTMIGGREIIRDVLGADDKMQAFLYRHLVPSNDLVVAVQKTNRPVPPIELVDRGLVAIPAGGSAQVHLRSPARWLLRQLHLQLQNPPEGVTLDNVTVVPRGLRFSLRVDSTVQEGFSDNLIIEALRRLPAKDKDGKTELRPVGLIPAVSIKVIAASVAETST